MLDLFRATPPRTPVVLPPSWPFIRRGLQGALDKVLAYYRSAPVLVRSQHWLIPLLHTFPVSKRLDLYAFWNEADRLGLAHARAHGATSMLAPGKIFRGLFYSRFAPEIILAVEEPFDPEWAHVHWREVSAVKPLWHPKSDLELLVPDGRSGSDEPGLSVVQLNMALLAVQYRAWWREQQRQAAVSGQGQRPTSAFVGSYVLPNMLPAHLDLALINRVLLTAQGQAPTSSTHYRHPFPLPDYRTQLSVAVDAMLKNQQRTKLDFASLLRCIPCVTADDALQALRLPDVAPTRQVQWALVAARLHVYWGLAQLAGPHARNKNAQSLHDYVRTLQLMDTRSQLHEQLPPDVLFDMDYELESLLELAT